MKSTTSAIFNANPSQPLDFQPIRASVFCQRTNPEGCTNAGVSSSIDDFILIPETHRDEPEYVGRADVLVLDVFHGCPRARPLLLVKANDHTMFGGNFVYTSDSRFPSPQPIKVHDRVERSTPSPERLDDNCPVCGGSRKLRNHESCR